jgi:hypothetical protein
VKSKFVVAAAVFATAFMFPASAWAAVVFAPAVPYAAGATPYDTTTGDFDGDGAPDIVITNVFSSTVSVLLNDGNGAFGAPALYSTGTGPAGVDVGDLSNDGILDIVTSNRSSDDVSVLLGIGDGTFAPAVPYPAGDGAESVQIGDFDGDSDPDLAVVNFGGDSVSLLVGNGDGTFAPKVDFPAGNDNGEVALSDFNGDGDVDLVTSNFNDDSVSVLLNLGGGALGPPVTYPVGNAPGDVVAADFNDDGTSDILTANQGPVPGAVSMLAGNGDGTFDAAVHLPVPHKVGALVIEDINGDGKLDIAAAGEFDDSVAVLLGNGDGTVTDTTTHAVGDAPVQLAAADFDGDGKPDLVTGDYSSNTASVLINQSSSTFTTGPTATISGTVRQGQTLTAGEGTPVPTQDSFAYKWFADGSEIGGQTAKTLLLTSTQVGKKISVEVTAKKAGLTDASDTSPETAPVIGIFVPGPTASISGYARIGSILTAHAGSPSPTPSILGYRWFADGVQLTPVTRTLTLTSAMRGKRIQVRVYAIKSGYLTATNLSPATAQVSSLQAKTISLELNDYTVKRGQRVYANIELLAPGEPWSILLDGKTLVSGKASSKGTADTSFVVPTNATLGIRTIRANGLFPDRTDLDRITIK